MNLNIEIFNEQTRYQIIPEFGPQGGYLRRLSSEIRGGKFYEVEMICCRVEKSLLWENTGFLAAISFGLRHERL